jgi:putative redox protein
MVEISGIYEGEKHCALTHGPSKNIIHTDAPLDNNGRGESFSPTDLLAASLGSCMMTVMGIYADKNAIDLKGSTFKMVKEMQASPRKISSITIELNLPAHLSESERSTLEKVADTCPVKLSLHPDVKIPLKFNYV